MKTWFEASLAIDSSLDRTLAELVKVRASPDQWLRQLPQPAHAHARGNGETEQRLYLLAAWREAPCYSERERAALGWTEAHDATKRGPWPTTCAYDDLKAHFSDEDQVKLTLLINIINGWNRIAVEASVAGPIRQHRRPTSANKAVAA